MAEMKQLPKAKTLRIKNAETGEWDIYYMGVVHLGTATAGPHGYTLPDGYSFKSLDWVSYHLARTAGLDDIPAPVLHTRPSRRGKGKGAGKGAGKKTAPEVRREEENTSPPRHILLRKQPIQQQTRSAVAAN